MINVVGDVRKTQEYQCITQHRVNKTVIKLQAPLKNAGVPKIFFTLKTNPFSGVILTLEKRLVFNVKNIFLSVRMKGDSDR